MARITLWVDPQTAAAANASVSKRLIVPETAVVRGQNKKWTEVMEVTQSSGAPSEKNPGAITFTVGFVIPADVDAANINNGKFFTQWFDVWPEAFHNPAHEKYKANNRNLGRLNSLLRAAGMDLPHGEQVDYGLYLTADEGDHAPIIGARVNVLVREFEWNGDFLQSAEEFTPVDA